MQHAISLFNQHKRFSIVQAEDRFSLSYMNWLGHFEFGLNHKPFYFGDEEAFIRLKNYSTGEINYWLLIWKNYYSYLLDNHTPNVVFFCFERYCEEPNMVLEKLYTMIDLDVVVKPVDRFNPKILSVDGVEKDILGECEGIYERLVERGI